MLLPKVIEGYILALESENKSKKYIRATQWHLTRFSNHLQAECGHDLQLAEIVPDTIRSYLSFHRERGLSSNSVHMEYKTLSALLHWCAREELIKNNPIQKVRAPQLPHLLPKVLSGEDVEKMLGYLKQDKSKIGKRNQTITLTLLDTGLRISELTNLVIGDLHFTSSYCTVRGGKGAKDRVVPLSPTLRKVLWRYIADVRPHFYPLTTHLFVDRFGRSMTTNAGQQILKRTLRACGIAQGSTHILRHTFATMYLRNGGDLERLRQILGHNNIQMTARYVHLVTADLVTRHGEISPLASFHI